LRVVRTAFLKKEKERFFGKEEVPLSSPPSSVKGIIADGLFPPPSRLLFFGASFFLLKKPQIIFSV